jgi:hypothetical protein
VQSAVAAPQARAGELTAGVAAALPAVRQAAGSGAAALERSGTAAALVDSARATLANSAPRTLDAIHAAAADTPARILAAGSATIARAADPSVTDGARALGDLGRSIGGSAVRTLSPAAATLADSTPSGVSRTIGSLSEGVVALATGERTPSGVSRTIGSLSESVVALATGEGAHGGVSGTIGALSEGVVAKLARVEPTLGAAESTGSQLLGIDRLADASRDTGPGPQSPAAAAPSAAGATVTNAGAIVTNAGAIAGPTSLSSWRSAPSGPALSLAASPAPACGLIAGGCGGVPWATLGGGWLDPQLLPDAPPLTDSAPLSASVAPAPPSGASGLSPGAAAPSAAAGSGAGISIFLLLSGLLLLGALWAARRLRLASESWRLAPLVLIPERPG